MVIEALPLKTTVPVDAVKVPELVNCEPVVPVNVSVLEPLCEKIWLAAIVNEVTETLEARFMVGVLEPLAIETMPISCFVPLLSVQVLVPTGDKVNVAEADFVQVVLLFRVKLPDTFNVGSFVFQSIITVFVPLPIIKLSVAIVPAINA